MVSVASAASVIGYDTNLPTGTRAVEVSRRAWASSAPVEFALLEGLFFYRRGRGDAEDCNCKKLFQRLLQLKFLRVPCVSAVKKPWGLPSLVNARSRFLPRQRAPSTSRRPHRG